MRARILRPLGALCGLVVMATMSHASVLDASILLERAANNKTISVKYEGVAAASLEMVINKVTVLTKTLEANDGKGELQLPVDTASLPNGESTVEVRLLDSKGVLVGTEVTKINIDRSGNGPAFLEIPKSGDTVQGMAEIKVGFKTDIRNVFVSFFVDDEFKSLKNYAPYGYTWDTTKVLNGYHEVQAWAVDDTNNTYKTEKFVVYVNNPGGMTARQPLSAKLGTTPVAPNKPATTVAPVVTKPEVKGTLPAPPDTVALVPKVAAKPVTSANNSAPAIGETAPANVKVDSGEGSPVSATTANQTNFSKPVTAAPVAAPAVAAMPVVPAVQAATKPVGVAATPSATIKPVATDVTRPRIDATPAVAKPIEMSKPVASAAVRPAAVVVPVEPPVAKVLVPATTAKPAAPVAPVAVAKPVEVPVVETPKAKPVPEVVFVPKMVPITMGSRLTNVKDFGIVMDGVTMKFDVPGRVQKGIPTAPVRYLFERKGLNVDWHQKDKTVTATNSEMSLWLQIGNPIAKINGQEMTMESAPYLYHSRSFVPMSFVGKALDVDITFDPSTQHMMVLSHNVAKVVSKPDTK